MTKNKILLNAKQDALGEKELGHGVKLLTGVHSKRRGDDKKQGQTVAEEDYDIELPSGYILSSANGNNEKEKFMKLYSKYTTYIQMNKPIKVGDTLVDPKVALEDLLKNPEESLK